MKFAPRNKRQAHSAFRVAATLLAIAVLPFLLHAAAPFWWSQHGVLKENLAADDYAPVNQGQLKNIARAAAAEMDARLTGGAGNEVHDLVNGWLVSNAATNDFAPINLGQLKAVAKPFYDRLIAARLIDHYPWLTSSAPSDDFAAANIGQLKQLFSFDIPQPNNLDDPLQDRVAAGQRVGNLALEDQAVWFWSNRFMPDSTFQSTYPRRLIGLSNIRSVSAGDTHLVVLNGDGEVLTWGKNNYGQLGDGTNFDRDIPVAIPNVANIRSVKAGATHTVALQADGTILAWGDNYYGELGVPDLPASSSPVQVAGLTDVRKVAAGSSRSVALKNDGSVWIWGYDHYAWQSGQDLFSAIPSQVPDLVDVVDIGAGYEHVVAVKSDGSVWAIGSNYANQLGNGNSWSVFQSTPIQVPNLSNITKIAVAVDHTLAIGSGGTVWAWGANTFGKLGDGTIQPRQAPIQVKGLTDVIAVAANYNCSMAMKSDGTVWAWGDGASGTLPDVDRYVPHEVGLGLFDPNHNGMDDRWEMEYFGNFDQPGDADLDGDGISNLTEYLRGTDPRDFFNGIAPVIEMVSGNNQIGDPGTILSKPLTVRVRSVTGEVLVNAPVEFKIASGSAAVATTPAGTFEQVVVGRTDSAGESTAYVQLSQMSGVSSRITASAAMFSSDELAPGVSYRVVNRYTEPPTPTPPPDPDPSPASSPTPSATAMPRAPYRYAIVDLGKDVYPTRVTNSSWVLWNAFTAEGRSVWSRWKAGVAEALQCNNGELFCDAYVSDINEQGTAVGRLDAGQNSNEPSVGAFWRVGSSTSTKVASFPVPWQGPFLPPTTLKYSACFAIDNSNTIFGQAVTEGSGGKLGDRIGFYDYGYLSNSCRWSLGGGLPVVISNAKYKNIGQTWTGQIDSISRVNSAGHFIGRSTVPLREISSGGLPTTLSQVNWMIDGKSIDFQPVDLNDATKVVGTRGGTMVIRTPGLHDQTIDNPAGIYPVAINNHVGAVPSPLPQPSPAISPQPTPVPAPQVLGWSGNALVVWELQPDAKTWHPFGLEEMVPSMDGWEYLAPSDMNDNGVIVGTAWHTDPAKPKAPGENHGFMLVPAELMVDANRDGEMSFDDPLIHEADQTSEERPYRFWLNNDHDEERAVDGDDREQDDYDGPADFTNPGILCERDLEDWSRLWISFKGLVGLIKSAGTTVEIAWRPRDGGSAWPTADSLPSIKIMLHDSQAGAEAREGTYLFDKNAAFIQAHGIWGTVIKPVNASAPCVVPTDFLQFVTEEKPFLHLLFEGWTSGEGQLLVTIKQQGRKVGELPPVYLKLQDVKSMYERYSVGEVPGAGVDYSAPWPTSHAASVSGPVLEAPADESIDYILFVHGWNMSPADKDSYGDTSFKRLWWQGYKGRFGCFRWPTFWFADGERGSWLGDGSVRIPGTDIYIPSPKHFDASEHRAWASSLGLLELCNQLNNRGFAGRLRIVAHSMGNVVVGEALRRSRAGQVVHTYIASQAALSAHSYDSSTPVMQFQTGFGPNTPDVYAHYFEPSAATYFDPQVMLGKAGRYVNYVNENDYALNAIHWQIDQQFKPDDGYSYGRDVDDVGNFDWFYGFLNRLRFGDDRYEIFSWAAESHSLALGSQFSQGVMGRSTDLKAAPFNFGNEHKFHSGQFRGMNMERWAYWQKLLVDFELKTTE